MKQITLYICDKCGEEFRKRIFCQRHEAECNPQGCERCQNCWIYRGEFRCRLLDNGKACKFEAKEMRM